MTDCRFGNQNCHFREKIYYQFLECRQDWWWAVWCQYLPTAATRGKSLKGLSHEIFTAIFWLEWIYIGLKGNRF
jgi:hypothetical protein